MGGGRRGQERKLKIKEHSVSSKPKSPRGLRKNSVSLQNNKLNMNDSHIVSFLVYLKARDISDWNGGSSCLLSWNLSFGFIVYIPSNGS